MNECSDRINNNKNGRVNKIQKQNGEYRVLLHVFGIVVDSERLKVSIAIAKKFHQSLVRTCLAFSVLFAVSVADHSCNSIGTSVFCRR